MDQLVNLRKEQGAQDYMTLLAPFYFRLGDYLATFIELNTDEFGNVKPLPDECDSEEDESAADDGEDDPREE